MPRLILAIVASLVPMGAAQSQHAPASPYSASGNGPSKPCPTSRSPICGLAAAWASLCRRSSTATRALFTSSSWPTAPADEGPAHTRAGPLCSHEGRDHTARRAPHRAGDRPRAPIRQQDSHACEPASSNSGDRRNARRPAASPPALPPLDIGHPLARADVRLGVADPRVWEVWRSRYEGLSLNAASGAVRLRRPEADLWCGSALRAWLSAARERPIRACQGQHTPDRISGKRAGRPTRLEDPWPCSSLTAGIA